MKPEKITGGQRIITFLLIAIILLLTAGFAVNAWQEQESPPEDTENTPTDTDGPTDDKNDGEASDGDGTQDENQNPDSGDIPNEIPPIIEIPKFYNAITGLEIQESEVNKAPIGFVLNSSMPLYGISNSDLTIEFPIEDGSTRLLTYTTNDALLWKVGSLAPSRSFISGMSNFFGEAIVAYGNDDLVTYSGWDSAAPSLDISKHSDCYYIENARYVYTSRDMVDELIKRNNLLNTKTYKSVPFKFIEEGETVFGQRTATSLTLPYSDSQKTELQYSESTGQYLYFKNGNRKIDMLTGKNISFANVFILFANATTYEKSEGTELVIDTTSGGKGYYVSNGAMTEITWSTSLEGKLEFKTLDGEILKINRGSSYIGYYKASQITNVSFY